MEPIGQTYYHNQAKTRCNFQVLQEQSLVLETGAKLTGVEIAYCTYGKLNDAKNNVIYVCHALTANADVADWWPGMVGEGSVFDTSKYFVVCANILGSCYGSTGANSIDPETGERYGKSFPFVTVRDLVKAHQLLAQHLQISSIQLLCGGSLGGQQALEWSILQPDFIKKLFVIATNAKHSAWGIAFNETQRMASAAGEVGLEVARAIAMLSYRSYATYEKTQTDKDDRTDSFRAASYQRYQGEKLKKRFDADCYNTLSKVMDSQNVGRGRGGVGAALSTISAQTLAVGISSDVLFPVQEQKLIAENINNAVFEEIESLYGHDGFLIETGKISELLKMHLQI